jgi:hypothetical protein
MQQIEQTGLKYQLMLEITDPPAFTLRPLFAQRTRRPGSDDDDDVF